MRLDINLASQPYEDARQFWMRWGTAVGALALLTLVLLTLDITGWINARRDRAAIAEKTRDDCRSRPSCAPTPRGSSTCRKTAARAISRSF